MKKLLYIALVMAGLGSCGLLQAQDMPEVGQAPEHQADEYFYENRVDASLTAGPLFNVGSNADDLLSATLVSVHWQLDEVGNEGWRRGNTEWIFSGYFNPVWDGVESRFVGGLFGPRYNFVQEGWKWVPYLGSRVGFGFTDSRDNKVYPESQGQDFVFTFMVEAGTRYIINERVNIELGLMYQHFSNGGLSEPAQENFGLDVLGPVASVNYRF